MILLVDNYDSFTYNLYQYVGEMTPDIAVYRNDAVTLAEIESLAPKGIIISPGPGYPKDAGLSADIALRFAGKIPLLGVCLGHQAICEALGGRVSHAFDICHGKQSEICVDVSDPLFYGLARKIKAARYHSLAVYDLPESLKITATAQNGQIMAVSDAERRVFGLQFHPESVMTPDGKRILKNFLKICGEAVAQTDADEAPAPDPEALKPYLQKVIDGDDLDEAEAQAAMDVIMRGRATNAQIGSFLTACRMKGETIGEITGFSKSIRFAGAYLTPETGTLDIVGTGGDLSHSFNISTTTAFVAAAAGVFVTKHGNRSVSSLSGSADVLEALGVKIGLDAAKTLECLKRTGLCFMFAPLFHKSMRYAASPRREIGVRSVFNILGPLANPAKAEYMLLGVYDLSLCETVASVLRNLGVKKALICHGSDGLDEVTVTGGTYIYEINDGAISNYVINPSDFGLRTYPPEAIKGKNAAENARILQGVLNGEKGAARDITLINAGAALYAANKALDIASGVKAAAAAIDSGRALEKLEALRAFTNSV